VAAAGNAHEFKNGRELSAWLGLVPRQHSSGGRNVLLGISKRGDRYLCTLVIHGRVPRYACLSAGGIRAASR
jgi:transposase